MRPIGLSRRHALAVLLMAAGVSNQALGQQLSPAQRQMLTSLPVFPWLSLGSSTSSSVRAPIQSMMGATPKPWYREGASDITGGTYMSVSTLAGDGMLGEPGLRILTMAFDTAQKLQIVIFNVDRGWVDANVDPLIKRLSDRYSTYAKPVRIEDGESEAKDFSIYFDVGPFVIEIAVPQHGSMIPVYFTTKAIHRRLREADRTYELFKPYIEN